MIHRKIIPYVGALVVLVMIANTTITPGVRHQHAGGDVAHSHQAGHTHTHPPSERGHSHPHQKRSPSEAAHSSTSPQAPSLRETPEAREGHGNRLQWHVHVALFGIELTLSDPFGAGNSAEQLPRHVPQRSGDQTVTSPHHQDEQFVQLTHPMTVGKFFHLLGDVRSPLPPQKVRLPFAVSSQLLAVADDPFSARDRDEPLLPPPKPASREHDDVTSAFRFVFGGSDRAWR